MSAEIPNSQGNAVARAEANICVCVLVSIQILRRRRKDPFMLHNYLASNGESLHIPYQPNKSVWGINVYVVCQSKQKASEANGMQAVGWPNSTCDGEKSERYNRRREVENVEDSSLHSHAEQT